MTTTSTYPAGVRALLAYIALACTAGLSDARAAVDFAREVRPILSDKCFHCHGPDSHSRATDLRFDTEESIKADLGGYFAVVAGNVDASEIIARVISEDEWEVMPPPEYHKPVTPEEVDVLRRWIAEGAEWKSHWSFEPPEKAVEAPADASAAIDHFVERGLAEAGLTPNAIADPVTLARRLHLDIVGLPPTPERVRRFVDDYRVDADAAYAGLVDELLASPHFGERMAVMWLDAARYGDTSVMHADGPRTMWPWRDWVINAYNANKPFDEFSIEQIAGDLIPDATIEQKIATGFNRNHPTSDEGGAFPEELRVNYVVDRVQTTANVWMGLTMECAQCHDHKFDPISQKEYYEFFAFFNNHADPGMQTRRGNQAPLVPISADAEYEERLEDGRRAIAESGAAMTRRAASCDVDFAAWLSTREAPNNATVSTSSPPPVMWLPFERIEKNEEFGDRLVADYAGGYWAGELRTSSGAGWRGLVDAPGGRKGLHLDGSHSYTTGRPGPFATDRPFTISFWIKPSKKSVSAILHAGDDQAHWRGVYLTLEKGLLRLYMSHSRDEHNLRVDATEPIESGKWSHVVVRYGGTSSAEDVDFRVNGADVAVAIKSDKLNGESVTTDVPLMIGGRSKTYPAGKSTPLIAPLADLRIYDAYLDDEQLPALEADPVEAALAIDSGERSAEQQAFLRNYFLTKHDPAFRGAAAGLGSGVLTVHDLLENAPTSMVMGDKPAGQMRMTYILDRGAYDSPREDEALTPGVPAVLPPLPADASRDRLGLAEWLFQDDHPLTARVAVNQIWQIYFGHGLVETPGDFGAQGAYPSHPELLDWLATDFREQGWNIKRLIRHLVMSDTYRRSSVATPTLVTSDPANTLYARASRFRLHAEFIRDGALTVSGLLNDDVGGWSVKPYQPPGLWKEVAFGGLTHFVPDKGDKLYRRSLYTYWKRSAPPPSMAAFDAPTRETCTMKRSRTNTPLQALVTLNDVQFVEAARFLAERMLTESTGDVEAVATRGFELVTSRRPTRTELAAIETVYAAARDRYTEDTAAAEALLSNGEKPTSATLPTAEHAAWTMVANLLLNLDETLTRE